MVLTSSESYLASEFVFKPLRSSQPYHTRGGADKSLAQPTSRCRRTESIVSLKRGGCSCAELQVVYCYRG